MLVLFVIAADNDFYIILCEFIVVQSTYNISYIEEEIAKYNDILVHRRKKREANRQNKCIAHWKLYAMGSECNEMDKHTTGEKTNKQNDMENTPLKYVRLQ